MTVKGTTKTGFEYEVELENFDDMEVVEGLADIDETGNPIKLYKTAVLILGKTQYESMKKHLQEHYGEDRIRVKAFLAEFLDIMTGNQHTKK